MHILSNMKITANTEDVLATLHKNRTLHKQIVVEARAGYKDRAMSVLANELKRLESSRPGTVAVFTLTPPQDHTKVYDTAIAMLEMHTEKTVVLDAQQVRNLVMDEWDWKVSFMMANSGYSSTARESVGASRDSDED